MTESLKVDGHEIVLTHGDRVVLPDSITKAEIVEHYLRVPRQCCRMYAAGP